MGLFSSKMDVFHPIENNVRELVDKLCQINQHEDQVNITLKEAILVALKVYSEQIRKYGFRQISYQQMNEMNKLITKTSKTLEGLPTYDKKMQKLTDEIGGPESIKDYLHEIEKRLKFDNIAPHEYRDILNTVLFYYQEHDALSELLKINTYKMRDNKNAICVLILELFVRLPQGDIPDQVTKNPVKILREVVKNMDATEEMLRTLDLTKVIISDAEHMKNMLENIKTTSEGIFQQSKAQIEKLEESNFQQPEVPDTNDCKKTEDKQKITKCQEHLAHLEKILHKYENITEHSSCTAEKYFIRDKAKEIQQLLKELRSVPEENEEICAIKSSFLKRADDLNKTLEQIENRTRREQQIAKCKEHLDHMEKTLHGYETVIDQWLYPIEKQLINHKVEEVQQFLKNLKAVPDVNETISGIKQYLSDRAVKVNNNLKHIMKENTNIINYIEKLNEIEHQIRQVVESNISLQDKRKFLKKQTEIINSIDTPNHEEIARRRMNALNRIEGLIIAEAINYLSQLKKTLNHHKMQAEQFAYPKRNSEYEARKNEILRLSKHLTSVSTGSQCVDASVQTARNKIDKVLKMLDKKASSNDYVITCLEYLERIKKEIIYTNSLYISSQTKVQSFNEFRGKINLIHNGNRRVVAKKCEICCQMHSYEKSLYSVEHFKALENLKRTFDTYEIDVQQFPHSLNSDCYRQKRDDILNFLKSVQMMSVDIETKNLMCDTICTILTVLETNGKDNETINQCFNNLKIIDCRLKDFDKSYMTYERKLEALAQYRQIIDSMSSITNVEVLSQITKVNQNITIAESKIQLEPVKSSLAQHKEHIKRQALPLESSVYKQTIDSLVQIKECVEDIPEGNPDLDSNKKTILNDINQVLKNVDEYVAHILFKKKSTENILDLQRHFDDFNPNTLNISKESIEFVTIIQSRAEHLEEKVKHYLGKNDSIDYYVIHENLVRLLEELDQLTCQGNEELLKATVGAMDYVKHLMEQLDNNVAAN